MKFDLDVSRKYEKQWVDTNDVFKQKNMLIAQVWVKTNRSIEASKEIKVPNGKNYYNKLSRKLSKKADIIIGVSHQIAGI